MDRRISQSSATVNDMTMSYLECGTGPLALCLHGFPDSAYTWRYLLPVLAEAGFRAVAPFTRGYSPTTIPPDGLYQTGALSDDANVLHEVLGGNEDAVIIGHDWGAPSAYGAAVDQPHRWSRVVGMAVPPGAAMGMAFMTNLEQLKRSWYMFFFQHPLADIVVPSNDLAFIDMIWRDWSPGYKNAEDVQRAKDCMSQPEHLEAALGYYRATLGAGKRDPRYDAIQSAATDPPPQPTLYLHGENDGCIGVEVARMADEMYLSMKLQVVRDAGHFLQLEQPDVVNQLIVNWITQR
jgi:pimeloyl-ACP methyl ester carboxylesterase